MKEEVHHIESYLQIQKIRYQDILDYEVSLEQCMEECTILKLTLQPLVENALYHGIKNKRGKGRITVKGYTSDNQAVFEVQDDGAGMTPEELKDLEAKMRGEERPERLRSPQARGGFGLFNVAERLRLNYGSGCTLEFNSRPGEGTRAVLRLPVDGGKTEA